MRIGRARERFEELRESISNYGALVASQRTQLNLLNRLGVDDSVENFDSGDDGLQHVTDKMIEEQESLIRDLEERKDTLEHKVKQIDRKMNTLYRSI